MLIMKAGNKIIAPLKPPTSPISVMKVYDFLSCILFLSDRLNINSVNTPSSSIFEFLVTSSTVKKWYGSGSYEKRPTGSLWS